MAVNFMEMLKINNIGARIGVVFLLLLFPNLRLSSQNVDSYFAGDDLSFKDRIAIRTNVVDWVLTSPNIAFDYDIVSTPYDKRSVGLGLKYNWNTAHTYIPTRVYNLFDARFDYRFYWRQQPFDNRDNFYGDWEREWIKSSKGFERLRARANCFRAVEKPKTHISIFVGPYASVSSFSIKLSAADDALGRQGIAFGAGLTGGIALPLYGYSNGSALDLEFGGSIGWHFASYGLYAADFVNNEYSDRGHRNKFVYYPLVSDVRVSLVYRFRSISKQHTEIDYDLIDRRYVARLMELDEDKVDAYNDSIRFFKDELDRRNQEIELYKQSVESQPGFIKAFTLEYLTPYKYMMSAPQKYTRENKDTLPKIHIDSIEQIVDPIMLSVREEIDSIPHVLSSQIDKEFVNQYNNISDADGKKVNRTSLIREIYTRLNTYIEDNNAKLVPGTFSTDVHTEKLNKYNVKMQSRSVVEVTYKDSVRTVVMSENEKIEWLNNIKKQAWADMQKRMQRVPVSHVEVPVAAVDSMFLDSMQVDSIMADSLLTDSLLADSMLVGRMMADSLMTDSAYAGLMLNDSLLTDTLMVDSLLKKVGNDQVKGKAKKKNVKVKSKGKSEIKKAKAKKEQKTEKAEKSKKTKKVKESSEIADSSVVSLELVASLPDSSELVNNDSTYTDVSTEESGDHLEKNIEQTSSSKSEGKKEKVKKAEKSEKPKKEVKKGEAKKAEKKKKNSVSEATDSIGVNSSTYDSIPPVDVDVSAEELTLCLSKTSTVHVEEIWLALYSRDYILKEDDED